MSKNTAIILIVIIVLVAVGFAFISSNGDGIETAIDAVENSHEGEGNENTTQNNDNTGVSNDNDTPVVNETEDEEVFARSTTFALPDLDGNIIASKDFEGKILVLNAWATWCPFCVDELPDFAELQAAFPDEVVVVAINREESRARVQGYFDANDLARETEGITFVMDFDDDFYRSIGGFAMPETLFVDPEGNVVVHKRGPMRFPEMKSNVESILNQ